MSSLPLSRFASVLRVAALSGLAAVGGPAAPARAQSNDDCMACHAEPGMTGTRDGKKIVVTVDPKTLKGSVHAKLECVACHQSLAGKDLPHDPGVKLVECAACHDKPVANYRASIHGRMAAKGDVTAPRCFDCHGAPHGIAAVSDPRSPVSTMNVPATCGGCHHEGSQVSLTHHIPQERILENYSESIHGEGLYKKGLTVTAVCTSCHSGHLILPHEDERSSTNRANIVKTCTRCHARIEVVHRKVVDGKLWEKEPNKVPSCTDCHAPHKVRRNASAEGMATKDCLLCHGKTDLAMTQGRQEGLAVRRRAGICRVDPCPRRLRPVPHGGSRLPEARLRDDQVEGGLRGLPRRRRRHLQDEHPRHAARQERSRCTRLPRLPRQARHQEQALALLADVRPERPGPLRPVPPRR